MSGQYVGGDAEEIPLNVVDFCVRAAGMHVQKDFLNEVVHFSRGGTLAEVAAERRGVAGEIHEGVL